MSWLTSKPSHMGQQVGNRAVFCTTEKLCLDSITITYTFKADEEDG